ncbi:unnamed protein product [Paramecium pentaurelia]|uniref:H(+)-exporting diphosphatase n=1 Tax=Paramecium pentaurelia TaxID=43138 RepID=A0A8S1WAE5_9CILI|nr:unnamed protein product [Paramecium pentaurelia]
MLPQKKPQYELLGVQNPENEQFIKFIQFDHLDIKGIIFLISPLGTCILLQILGFSYLIQFISTVLHISIITIIFATCILDQILRHDDGNKEMKKIALSIEEGAEGFFKAQYGTIFNLSLIFALLIFLVYWQKGSGELEKDEIPVGGLIIGLLEGGSFLFGAFCSGFAGFAGMWVSIKANSRVASAARTCYNKAIQLSFRGGYFAAVINIALAIFGISVLFLVIYFYCYITITDQQKLNEQIDKIPLLLIGYGFGASFVAMFAQLGGGIYTKAADVGADLIGKIENDIPEDDPRNPAVIADLVGDNVGDCAGQSADLFESITAEILSAMILGATLTHEANLHINYKVTFMLFPLVVHCLDIISSTIGMYFVRTQPGIPTKYIEDPLCIMKKGYRIAMIIGFFGFFFICHHCLNPLQHKDAWLYFGMCGLIGIIVSYLFIEVTQYYTDYHYEPVKRIAQASKTGHATNIIAGLSVGMESTGIPILIISVGVLGAYYLGEQSGIKNHQGELIGGLFGTAIATMGMFCTGVYILSMAAFGPIADNAGGIVEMSGCDEQVRQITDRLDAVGNVTKANAKGYSVGSASLASFLLFRAFIDEVNFLSPTKKILDIDITQPEIFISGLIGACTVFVFSSWALRAVGNAAQDVIKEVRRQFRENEGILQGTAQPNYKQCVEIVTKAGLREMIKPGLLSVLTPLILGITLRAINVVRMQELLPAKAICAFLMFSTCTGILQALFLNNAGGAWDNSKKYVETGELGGKGSETHKAAVTGDTVGDPCKDTAGPSIHILIKLYSTITIVMVPLFVD